MRRIFSSRNLVLSLLAALAALACIPRIDIGISTLDDGFYAYAAESILDGKLIHRDFFSQYVGYQHYIHALFFRLYGENYLTLRYPLIISQFISCLAAALIFRQKPFIVQLAAITIALGFGVLLFKNPSTSWSCVALVLVITALLSSSKPGNPSRSKLLALGLLLGLVFGIRHPTAIFLGMGVLCHQTILTTRSEATFKSSRASNVVLTLGLLLALTSLLAYMLKASTVVDLAPWFVAPVSYMVYSLSNVKRTDSHQTLANLTWIGVGFIAAISPWLISTTAHNNWKATWIDLSTMPTDYSSMLTFTTADFAGNILFIVSHPPNAQAILGAAVSAVGLLFPLLLAASIWRLHKNPRIQAWALSPVSIMAAFHTLVLVALVSSLYLSYVLCLQFLSILALATQIKNHRARNAAISALIATSAGSFVFLTPQFEPAGNVSYLGSMPRTLSKCWLPRCDLRTIADNNIISKEAYDALEKIKRPDSTVTVLPWGYHYEFSYPSNYRPKYPDIRLPLYRHVPAEIAFQDILNERDPVILIEKVAMRDESVYPEFLNYFAIYFAKAYDGPIFMILVKKNRSQRASHQS